MISLLVAGGIALLVAAFGTPLLMRWLTRRSVGQHIRDDGPKRHAAKAGTPTMGGVAFVVAVLAGYLAGHLGLGTSFTRAGVLVVGVTAAAASVGFVDDYIKVHRRRSLGLSMRAKLASQILVAAAFAVLAVEWAHVDTALSFTRGDGLGIQLGHAGWIVWAIVMIVGTANAVNLTDGLDGLASGSATFAFAALALIGYWQFRHFSIYGVRSALDLALVALAFAGGCAGFLWWNAAPAKIFMGDTGSLAIGAALAALALQMNLQLLLPVLGGLYVIVTLSVMIQVASFRLFGRRVFRMAPLHHHFELRGWPETTVIVRFWILAGLCTVTGLLLFYVDFLSVSPTH